MLSSFFRSELNPEEANSLLVRMCRLPLYNESPCLGDLVWGHKWFHLLTDLGRISGTAGRCQFQPNERLYEIAG